MSFFAYLDHLRWQDYLDIFLVFLVIFRLLQLIRGTRAVQILTGLGILSLAFILSDYLRLFVFNYLLKQIFEYLFLIVVVLFQDEIKRALANIGKNPFHKNRSIVSKSLRVVDEIVEASQKMASKHTGALIAIERQVGLKNYSESAVYLNARVSAELLLSIFQVSSPIHDGATIIKDLRIHSSGSFVPVNTEWGLNFKLDKNLGTRHRAGVMISMETDAVVIIVSEERGEIALAIGGILKRSLNAMELKRELLKHLKIEVGEVEELSFFDKLIQGFKSSLPDYEEDALNEERDENEKGKPL